MLKPLINKKRERFNIYISYPAGKLSVYGWKIEFPGFDEFDFFVHSGRGDFNSYDISEIRTGACLPFISGLVSKQQAVDGAYQFLCEKGLPLVKEVIGGMQSLSERE